jgi:hypothetical protein
MKLNIGCGRHVLDGWTNIDIQQSPHGTKPPDIMCDIRQIPLPDECADEIMAIHVFEHFYKWEVNGVLAEWRRLLKPGGLMVLELPDLLLCARNLINRTMGRHVDQLSMWGIYGDPRAEDPYMHHKWGWTPDTITVLLRENGFRKTLVTGETQWHRSGRELRDMRVEARRV